MEELFNKIDTTTYVLTGIILASAIACYLYIRHQKANGQLITKRRWIEQIPSFISTLGVLGTFWGITVGLLDFNSNDLGTSIPELLDGMKTAFFTSLAGMIGSLCLSKVVSSYYDEQDGGVSDINMAAGEIVKAVKEMSEANRNTLQELKQQTVLQSNNQTAFYQTSGTLLNNIKDTIGQMKSDTTAMIVQIQAQTQSLDSIAVSIGNVESTTTSIQQHTSKVGEIHRNVGEITDTISGMSTSQEEISAEVKSFGEKLHGEVVEIEDKMEETNKLLTQKFDDFTELLKKSNTEALVEVMKNVTTEFQKQMNALINKLIQENFDQLNKSVEKLNIWQQENKEMIASLTKQYKDMAGSFEQTSTTLSSVSEDTKMLVSDGGKLRQLIDSLNQVLIEDTKFVEVTTKLENTVELTKSNMEQFDESTKSLNEWVRKQRNFVDGVQLLIEKLDELNKLRNYNEQFWQSTKRSMEEGIGIIKGGSEALNSQLTNLDQKFYTRLSATLAELDTCIQAMVNGNTRR